MWCRTPVITQLVDGKNICQIFQNHKMVKILSKTCLLVVNLLSYCGTQNSVNAYATRTVFTFSFYILVLQDLFKLHSLVCTQEKGHCY